MEDKGFFTISRKLVDNWIYPTNQDRKLTQFEAWVEIIRLAKYVCTKKLVQGNLIIIPRGYFDTTVSQLALIWRWDKRTVEKFLQELEADGMIRRFKINSKSLKSCTLIKVNNYNKLQPEIWEQCKSEYKTKCNLNCRCCEGKKEPKTPVGKPEKIKKDTYGEYGNVKLTAAEVERLHKEYGEEATNKAIKYLSSYKKEKNYKTKDDNLTLRRWVFNACGTSKKPEEPKKDEANKTDDFYMSLSRS